MAIPTAEDVVEEEGEVLAVIGAALQDACDKTHSFFSDHEEGAPDASLSPNLVRWFAKRYLDTAGHTTHTLATDYEREALGNNGLLVACTKYQIRVRKEVAGFALPPAASEALDTFYGQEQLELPFPNFQPQSVPGGAETSIKLVLLWDVDSDYRLSSLTLALPRSGGCDPQVYWSVPIQITDHTSEEGGGGDLDLELLEEIGTDATSGNGNED